jgi:hypothetical protein
MPGGTPAAAKMAPSASGPAGRPPSQKKGAALTPPSGTNGPPAAPPSTSSCKSPLDLPSPFAAASSWFSVRHPPPGQSGVLRKKEERRSMRVVEWQFCCNSGERQGYFGTGADGAEGELHFLAPSAPNCSSQRNFRELLW